jgi:lipoprotein-anchoring transpeptidase ErfK/SrfK
MRALGSLALAAAVVALPSLVSGLAPYDGRYVGLITCDVLPGQTVGPLKTEFSMTVAEGEARYEREVLRPTGSGRLGVTERGGGVASDGDITVTGSAAGQTWSYEATYRGRFEGRNLRLSGSQLWRLPGRSVLTRSCTIGVQRSGD